MHAIERNVTAALAMLRRAWKAHDGHALQTASVRFDRARGHLPPAARGQTAAQLLARWRRRDCTTAQAPRPPAAHAPTKCASTKTQSSNAPAVQAPTKCASTNNGSSIGGVVEGLTKLASTNDRSSLDQFPLDQRWIEP